MRWLLASIGGLVLGAASGLAQGAAGAANDPAADETEALANITALEANALFETGQTREARSAAQSALLLDPDNQVALTVLAMDAETQPDWRRSAAAWDEVARVSTDANAASFAAKRGDAVARQNGAFGTLDAFFFGDAGDDEQSGLRARGRIARKSGPAIRLGLELRRLEDSQAFDGAGINEAVDEEATTVRIGLEAYPAIGRAHVDLVGNGDVNGVEAGIERQGRNTRFSALAAFNRPYYDFSQGVLLDTALDELELGAGGNVGRAYLDGRLGARQYLIDDRETAAEATFASAGVSYRFGDKRTAPRLATRFDGEFVSSVTTIDRGAGEPVAALPLRDREIVSIGAYKRFEPLGGDDSYIDAGLGYREDLDEASGGFARVEGRLRFAREYAIGFDAEYSDVSTRRVSNDAYTAVTLSLTRTFPKMGRSQ